MYGGVGPFEQLAIVGAIVLGGLVAVLLLSLLVRSATREASRATSEVLASPWNDRPDDGGRARIGSVVSIDDEVLVELVWTTRPGLDETEREVIWLVGPSSTAGMTTLDRWRDTGSPVNVAIGPQGVLLHTPQARAHLRCDERHDPDK